MIGFLKKRGSSINVLVGSQVFKEPRIPGFK